MPKKTENLCTQKKRGTFSLSLDAMRSSTTYYLPITTSKAHATRRERRRFTLGDSLKVSKFQSIQCISYFAFFYSKVCINGLCGFSHRQYVWFILYFLKINFLQKSDCKNKLFIYQMQSVKKNVFLQSLVITIVL